MSRNEMEDLGRTPSPPLPVGTRKALIIATWVYDHLPHLAAPEQDAQKMAEMLGDPDIGGFEVKRMDNPTASEVMREVNQIFNGREKSDVVLIYFSGHGIKDRIGRLFLAARDTDEAILLASGVPAPFIYDAADQSASRKLMLIFDTCYSGAATVRSAGLADFTVDIGAAQLLAAGRYTLVASRAGEYAFEDEMVGGAFTSALVDGVHTGKADFSNSGFITVEDAYRYAHIAVTRGQRRQTPRLESHGVEGSPLLFARNPMGIRAGADDLYQLVDTVRGPHPRAQVAALDKLTSLLDDPNPAIVAVARDTLHQLASTPSHPLSAAAKQVLGIGRPYQPPPELKPEPDRLDDLLEFSEEELAGLRFDVSGVPLGPRRILPLEDEPSNLVARYLFPTERYRGEWRRHYVDAPLAAAISGLTAGLAFRPPSLEPLRLPPEVWHVPTGSIAQWLLIVIAVLTARRALAWPTWRMALTNKRIMVVRGVFRRRVTGIPLSNLSDFSQPFLGRILNYGTLIFRIGDWRSHRVRRIPSVNEVYLRVIEEQYEPDAVEARLGREPEED